MALAITRLELSAEELRGEARRAQDGDQACRLVALALVLEGASRTAAARAGGMDRQTLRDWVIRYNEAGVEGLRDRPRSGRRPRLSAGQLAELGRLVEAGPDVAVHGVVPRSPRCAVAIILRVARESGRPTSRAAQVQAPVGAAAPPTG